MRSSILLTLVLAWLALGASGARAEDAESGPAGATPVAADTPPEVADVPEAAVPEEPAAEPAPSPEVATPERAEASEPGPGPEAAVEPLDAQMPPGPAAPAPQAAEAGQASESPAGTGAPEVAKNGVRLGQVGYDAEGRAGRIHVVVRGDTLWDISEAYLGTPWVWPSVWQDNRDIENPHWIYPGDRIWITDGVMRVVSREEADALLAGSPAAPEPSPFEDIEPPDAGDGGTPPFLAAEPRTQRVSQLESAGFVTAEAYESSASIVDGVPEKVMLSQGDRVYIGLGAGDVRPGDQYTVFRKQERVFDPDTGRLLGYHVDVLGWLEVQEPGAEASLAVIRKSGSEVERGDRIVPRQEPQPEIAVLPPPQGLEAKVSFFAKSRTMMGMDDFVYLNRGSLDGVEIGSPLEVYRPAYVANETARSTRVEVPDRVIAQLLVVKSEPNSSVAFITHTEDEIELGDRVRGASN
jgi:hypothetical protein